MKRLLVTGGSGLVGGHIIRQARGKWEVHGTFYRNGVCFDHAMMHRVSLSDESSARSLIQSVRPHVIIHTAAWTDVDGCEKKPELARQINFIGAFEAVIDKPAGNRFRRDISSRFKVER